MKKAIFMMFLLLILITGCNQNAADGGIYGQNEDQDGARLITSREEALQKIDIDNDPPMDRTISDQNPNFVNFSGNRNDIGKDVDKARDVVKQTKEFEPGPIWVNGEDMWVTVYKKGMLSERDQMDAQSRIHKMLLQALPRYDIEVRVREDRT
ncbi:hypothetical protein C0966_13405 [Bacillus methanolicus]|uniref:hypothetical protein n=1 Tax=Bacillus methanolicus TaxID=1471 RepID=UPI00237FFD35|nr:hypothetical protein [Bacillus methanolicus]MDE3840332.1 hypothetical protein [Bacillus methanolicus]